jgi:hypothetical protein
MNNLIVLEYPQTTEERIQNKIESFRREMIGSDISTENVEDILEIVCEYLSQFEEHPMLEQVYIKINEANFWLHNFNNV